MIRPIVMHDLCEKAITKNQPVRKFKTIIVDVENIVSMSESSNEETNGVCEIVICDKSAPAKQTTYIVSGRELKNVYERIEGYSALSVH